MKRLLFVLVPLLAAAVGAGFVYFKQAGATAVEEAPAAAPPMEYGLFTQFDGLIVNPAGTGGRRHLLVSVGFESPKKKTLEELTEKEIVVRDVLIQRLSALTVEQLASAAWRVAIKDSLLLEVNAVLDGEITRLYFTQYVLQ